MVISIFRPAASFARAMVFDIRSFFTKDKGDAAASAAPQRTAAAEPARAAASVVVAHRVSPGMPASSSKGRLTPADFFGRKATAGSSSGGGVMQGTKRKQHAAIDLVESDGCCAMQSTKRKQHEVVDLVDDESDGAPAAAPSPARSPAARAKVAPTPAARQPASATAAYPVFDMVGTVAKGKGARKPARTRAPATAAKPVKGNRATGRPNGSKFLHGSMITAGPRDCLPKEYTAPRGMRLELIDGSKPQALVIVFRNASTPHGANEALQEWLPLFPTRNAPIPGPGKKGDRGMVPFEGKMLLHAQMRALLSCADERLRASHPAAAAEVGELAGAPYTTVTGALLYKGGAKLAPHLDDIRACNSKLFDPRVVSGHYI